MPIIGPIQQHVNLVVAVLPLVLEGRVHELLLLLAQLDRDLVHGLLVVAVLVAPADVLVGRLGEVLLDVVERVLRHVGDAAVLVAVDLGAALVGLRLADEHLDERRLARAVRAEQHAHARPQRERHAVGERRRSGGGEGEGGERVNTFTTETIKAAVKLWCDKPYKARATYGHISTWDISGVTSMFSLFYEFCDKRTTFNDDIGGWDGQ